MKSGLIVVDMQRDFMPGGALSVPDADLIIPKINRFMDLFSVVIATKDFHPKGHVSFASSHPGKRITESVDVKGKKQVLWPDHCKQGTVGSELDPRLLSNKVHHIFHKGTNEEIDSYSAFFDNAHNHSTGLAEQLKDLGITHLFFCGVATEYCVLFSVLDALQLGFAVFVIEDACKGIDIKSGDEKKAFELMEQKGAKIVRSSDLTAFLSVHPY